MKQIYTIGRDPQCDIIIQDVTDIVSRVHAVLRVESNGKVFIKDQSKNGTYINGMRITPNVEVSVSRKDCVSFANIRDLDWSVVPNPRKKAMSIISIVVLGIAITGLLLWITLDKDEFKGKVIKGETVVDTVVVKDTVTKVDTIEKIIKIKEESPKENQTSEEPKEEPKEVLGTEISL